MRVNISYSIDLEAVPDTVSDLILKAKSDHAQLSQKLGDILTCLESHDAHNATLHLDDVRKGLFKIDARLLDCGTILEGYQKTLAGIKSAQHDGGVDASE